MMIGGSWKSSLVNLVIGHSENVERIFIISLVTLKTYEWQKKKNEKKLQNKIKKFEENLGKPEKSNKEKQKPEKSQKKEKLIEEERFLLPRIWEISVNCKCNFSHTFVEWTSCAK